MKVAVTYNNGEVFQHFGHCENFKIFDVKDKKVISSSVVSAVGSGHGALAAFLKERNVDVLICGGIGAGAREALAQAHISVYPGVLGSADESIAALLSNKLVYDINFTCTHHSEGHNCGEDKHGCGSNN